MEVNSIGKLTPVHGSQPSNMVVSDGYNKPSLLDLDDISDDEDEQGLMKFDHTTLSDFYFS